MSPTEIQVRCPCCGKEMKVDTRQERVQCKSCKDQHIIEQLKRWKLIPQQPIITPTPQEA